MNCHSRLLPNRQDWADVRRHPRADLTAGLTVAVVALPLALAFGAASGLGARSGLITAIIAGALAAIFGGSNLQVTYKSADKTETVNGQLLREDAMYLVLRTPAGRMSIQKNQIANVLVKE